MRTLAAIVILVIGIIGIVVGVMYMTEPAHSLPSLFPGYIAHSAAKHSRRGDAALVLGIVLVVVGLAIGLTGNRQRAIFR